MTLSLTKSMTDSDSYTLVNYVGFLEKELEDVMAKYQAAKTKHEEEKTYLTRRLHAALQKFDDAQGQIHSHRHDFLKAERRIHQERIKEEILEDRLKRLELELEMKNDRQNKDAKAIRQLEKENELMKKQATLGWMLGCLSEIYLQEESKGGAIPLLIQKMIRHVQGELEKENVVLSCSGESPLIKLEHVEDEIRRLINCARLVESDAQSSPSIKDIRDDKPLEDMSRNNKTLSNITRSQTWLNEVESERSPSARYIVDCFDNGVNGPKVAKTNSKANKLELLETSPRVDVEQARVSGSTWADVKLMNPNDDVLHDHTDIKVMLSKLQATLDQHLASQANMLPSTNATSQSRSLAKLLNQPKRTISPPRKLSPAKHKPQR